MEEKKEVNTDRVAIVTGGTRGIGRAIVYELVSKGIKVVINYRKSDNIANQMQEEFGDMVRVYRADISKRDEVKGLIAYTLQEFGNIDILVNNAGISQTKLFTDISDTDWDTMIQTNLTANFYTIQEVLPTMLHNKNGDIINISSIWGVTGGSCEVHYSAAKAGLNGLTKALAKELGPSNIRVNAIAPGIIETDMTNDYSEEELANIRSQIPLEKIGNAKNIAKCVGWIVDDNYTTGQIIEINGGWNI
ncbi:MAG: 3-oxoacyl-ACP reductase FabG [Clostridia bacterium]|nr:3-oxoacyl-ACP reductase FabG [Clostridia bacterium]